MNENNNYIVITGDVIASKKHNNFTELFTNSIKKIKYPASLIHPFKIAKGDELQAIFSSDLNIPVFLRELRNYIRPLKIRIGIGMGIIDDHHKIISWESSGSAFEYSKDALEKIDQDRKFKTMLISSLKVDELANTIFLLLDSIEFSWSEAEWDAVHINKAQKVNNSIKGQESNIEELLTTAHFEEICYAERKLDLLIKSNF